MRHGRKRIKKVFENKIILVLVIVIIVLVSFYAFLHPPNTNMNLPPPRTAAIIDQLSLTEPNQTLIQASTETLQSAGFTVDYYEPKDVTVEFYRDLPSKGYGLIIFRVHSAGGIEGAEPLYLFTSEVFVLGEYWAEYLAGRVVCVGVSMEHPPFYFGITPQFVRHSMKGKFQNTTILMMTCRALTYEEMAKAFVEKGASVYIGWTDLVEADHNDQATSILLQQLMTKSQTVAQAVTQVMNELGPDPRYSSQLRWCPAENGDYAVP